MLAERLTFDAQDKHDSSHANQHSVGLHRRIIISTIATVQATNQKPIYARASSASKHFQIGRATLWAWVRVRPGFPQPLKASSRVTLFDIAAIERYLQAQAVK